MTKIQESKDCGNSPKNKFVQDVAVALETGKITSDALSDEVSWRRGLGTIIEGKKALLERLAEQRKPCLVIVEHAISHGRVGASCGELEFADGRRMRFSHFFEFTSAKASRIAAIKSY